MLPPEVRFVAWDQPSKLAGAGLLYRPDPQIGDTAWQRQAIGQARGFSLCGVTHTLSSSAAMSTVADLMRAPLYPWDAVICTSTVARDVFRYILDAEMEHLQRRFGAARFTLPQLPLIPLGVHADDFAFDAETRAGARTDVGLGAEEVAVLFTGRLSFHGKAHPMPMLLGLEAAAQQTGRRLCLLMFGQFPSPRVGAVFQSEAARFAPSVRFLHLDGAVAENWTRAWSAADIFTSLADNVQETFGLTPVEAMAAGLPVVVSDWNGYKDTVRDGIDGFRVRTMLLPAGAGLGLAERFDMRMDDYDRYIGKVSQLTAVDVGSAVEAYVRLIESPELRASMGAAGRQRAREVFDWAVVFRRYLALWDDLAERRRSDPRVSGEEARARRPDRPDPFGLFATFPTATIGGRTRVRLVPGLGAEEAIARRGLDSVAFAGETLPADDVIAAILSRLTGGDVCALVDLAPILPNVSSGALVRAVAWLAKMGIVAIEP
jgi:glycosyltransferase involved in cell wall biosynthesis